QKFAAASASAASTGVRRTLSLPRKPAVVTAFLGCAGTRPPMGPTSSSARRPSYHRGGSPQSAFFSSSTHMKRAVAAELCRYGGARDRSLIQADLTPLPCRLQKRAPPQTRKKDFGRAHL